MQKPTDSHSQILKTQSRVRSCTEAALGQCLAPAGSTPYK